VNRRGRAGLVAVAAFLIQSAPVPAAAQRGEEPRFQVGVGLGYTRGYDAGRTDATLATGGGGGFTLFETDSTLRSSRGVELRLGWRFAEPFWVEAGLLRGRSDLETRIGADAEGVPGATLAETLTRYMVDASLLYEPPMRFAGGRGRAFGLVGVGYIRQLHEANALLEDGFGVQLGGGAKLLLLRRRTGWLRGIGARAEGRLLWLPAAIDLRAERRTTGSIGVSALIEF
jgi:hypothetical protein